ncbi:MAG: quinolinate synthase NadA [Clostridiales bacterium]|nr:quinolinate synthase NadA [Clostridiales bacterium]
MSDQTSIVKEIMDLKKKQDAVILAHYYVGNDVQEIADYVGDSYFLAKKSTELSHNVIIFCGVKFMGESAKILNPQKKVYMANENAECSMAHMVDPDYVKSIKETYPDLATVCYVNSTTKIKAMSDVCVTSSNAVSIVRKLPNQHILFIPDKNLAHFIAKQVPEKEFIFNEGFCHVHNSIQKSELLEAKKQYPNALCLAHPECTGDLLDECDFVGSTSQIIDYATGSDAKEFLICTEVGVFYELKKKNPDKLFHAVSVKQTCGNMKKNTLEGVLNALQGVHKEVVVEKEYEPLARKALDQMLYYAVR